MCWMPCSTRAAPVPQFAHGCESCLSLSAVWHATKTQIIGWKCDLTERDPRDMKQCPMKYVQDHLDEFDLVVPE